MPYIDIPGFKNEPFVRVTEATGACGCPYPAYLDHHHPQGWKRPKRKHYSAVRGTSVHDAIEAYVVRTEKLPRRIKKPREAFELQMIWEDISKPPEEQLLKWEIQRCWINFMKWWYKAKKEYSMRVLYCEKKVWSVTHKFAGTVDIIALMKIHGKWYIVVLDWKSSQQWAIEYKFQCSGYQGAMMEMHPQGKLTLPKYPHYDRTLTVVLGNTAPQEIWSEYTFKGFLNCLNKYRNPKSEPNQTTCVFCGDYYRCEAARHYEAVLEHLEKGCNS